MKKRKMSDGGVRDKEGERREQATEKPEQAAGLGCSR
jgi:hypothetical protein